MPPPAGRRLLASLKAHLADGGLGHIAEIFDGDALSGLVDAWHRPGVWLRSCGLR